MVNTNLQNQLGLGLAVKQTNAMNGISPVSSPTPTSSPLLGESDYSNSGYFQDEKDSSDSYTNKGIQYQYVAPNGDIGIGSNQQSAQNNVVSGSSPLAYGRASAPSASFASSPTSVTNNTVDSLSGVQSGVVNKKKRNIAESTTQASMTPLAPVEAPPAQSLPDMSGFREATAGQDVQFRQSYRDALKNPVVPTKPVDATGLSGAELQAYNMLTPQEQAQYKALATQGIKVQTDYLTKSKANIEYQKSQEEQRLAMQENADAISDMMSQKNIEESQKQVANLKQNLGYIGSGGQPGVSSQKLDAISNQVTLADRTLKNIIEAERLQKANREIGQEKNAEIFTRQIKILQDDLDSKVNKTVQGALNRFNSAELEGKLDTIPEIEAFQQQLYAQLDGDLSSIMDTNIQARQFLIERYDKLAESQKAQMQANEKAKADYQKNSNTLNKDMSEALGYYVNNNGEALIDQKTGARIEVPLNTEKVFDQDTGNLMLFTTNKDGTITARMRKVGLGKPVTPEWKQTENGNWYNANSTTNPQFQSIDRQSAIGKYGSTPAVRNFNPGNIMDTGFGGQKVEGERFTVFSSPQEGFNALVAKIQNIQNGGSKVYSPDMTLLQYIGKYAPSSDNNNPQGYANAIANNLGISINTKIGQIDPVKLAEEHARHEDGNSYRMLKDIGIIGGGETQATSGQYSDTQKNVMSGMDAKNISAQDAKILAQNGLKAEDIYNYKAQQKVGKWSQGLDETEFKRVNSIIDDLAGNQVTKTFLKSQEAYNFATKASIGNNATDNQALIYAFAKAMDPDSVVREGEYATVQKYSQTWGQKFGMDINRILNGQEFISEEAKKNIVNTIKSKYGASKESYESLRNTQIKKINDIAGKDIGSTALPSDVMELIANPQSNIAPAYTPEQYDILNSWYTKN